MKLGYAKVSCATPKIKVADVEFNVSNIIKEINLAHKNCVELLVLPELAITGYTCGDLFYQSTLLDGALVGLNNIVEGTKGKNMLVFVGVPIRKLGAIYNTAVGICNGEILGVVPKTYLPNYNEFYEKRQFTPSDGVNSTIKIGDKSYPFGAQLLFQNSAMSDFVVGVEICEDLWVMSPPSIEHAMAGATIIVNLSASNETIGKAEYRRNLVKQQSASLLAGYLYTNAGYGESTTDMVFSGHNLIAENGTMIAETPLFKNGSIVSEIDVAFLATERSKLATYRTTASEGYEIISFNASSANAELTRTYPKRPFVPSSRDRLAERTELILTMQAEGLKKRVAHARASSVVIGISGGLDSTLALLVAVRTTALLQEDGIDLRVLGITMPCFGTTKRTNNNSKTLCEVLGVEIEEIDITEAVKLHLSDLKHQGELDITYENAQARERTQILMNRANMTNGLVVGTGDLSELALGWATYNGDHMSMYGVNSSVPKTLVKHLVRAEATTKGGALEAVLNDIIATPISPELLPPTGEEINQKTEDKVGPYILHDYFMYGIVRMGFTPSKVFELAKVTFSDDFSADIIKKWLLVFLKRFFQQQFKRSCMPDGIKIGSVSLSPRGDWRMPSDGQVALWISDLEDK
ncbi:MAG: NAD(+) synthase [Bacillota bacterium]